MAMIFGRLLSDSLMVFADVSPAASCRSDAAQPRAGAQIVRDSSGPAPGSPNTTAPHLLTNLIKRHGFAIVQMPGVAQVFGKIIPLISAKSLDFSTV